MESTITCEIYEFIRLICLLIQVIPFQGPFEWITGTRSNASWQSHGSSFCHVPADDHGPGNG